MTSKNIVWHHHSVTKEERRKKLGHHSFVLWFTGLSGSGKSTLANALNQKLFNENISSYVLDGDNVRHGLNKDLGFSELDRKENIRRIGEVAKLFVDSGQVVLTAFISPYREDRELVRNLSSMMSSLKYMLNAHYQNVKNEIRKGCTKKRETVKLNILQASTIHMKSRKILKSLFILRNGQ